MAVSSDLVLVVKHTFLEFVNETPGSCTNRSRTRTMSDTGFHLPETPQHSSQALVSKRWLTRADHEDFMSNSSTKAGVDSDDDDAGKNSSVTCSQQASRLSSWADDDPLPSDVEESDERTTVMFRNVPNDYCRDSLMEMLDNEGFAGQYNFIYLPVDFRSKSGFGYAFINLVNGVIAEQFKQKFNGFAGWAVPSQKVAEVTWSHPSQGLEVHVERYRNSPVMHEAVPDAFKPAMFENGNRIIFPPPTKAIRMPRIRHNTKRQ